MRAVERHGRVSTISQDVIDLGEHMPETILELFADGSRLIFCWLIDKIRSSPLDIQGIALVLELTADTLPLKKAPQLATIQPDAVGAALVGHHTAASAGIYTIHQLTADRTGAIARAVANIQGLVIERGQSLVVNLESLGDGLVQ